MSKLKLLRETNRSQPKRDRTLAVERGTKTLAEIEAETVLRSRQVAKERVDRKEEEYVRKCELLSVTKLCCPRWMMVCRKLFGLPLLKGQDRVKLAGYAKNYSKGRGDFLRYMDWCLDHWRIVVDAKLSWMRDVPSIPSVPVFVRWSQHFEHFWLHKEEADRMAGMTERDKIIANALSRGKSYDAAERDADERMGLVYQREAVEKERKELARERGRLEVAAMTVGKITKAVESRSRAAALLKTRSTTKTPAGGFKEWRDEDE